MTATEQTTADAALDELCVEHDPHARRWTPCRRPTPAIPARRWRSRRSPTCSTRGSCATRPEHPDWPDRDRFVLSRRPRVDAPLLDPPPHRLRALARRAQALPPAGLADRRPPRVRPRPRHRGDDRPARPGHRDARRARARRAHAQRARSATTSSTTTRSRSPRDGDMQEGSPARRRRSPATSALGRLSPSTTTTTSRSRATRRSRSPRTSASATRPTAGTSRTSARTSRLDRIEAGRRATRWPSRTGRR